MIPQELIDWIAGEKAKGYTSEQLYDILMQYNNEEAEVREALKIVFQPAAPEESVNLEKQLYTFSPFILVGMAMVVLIAAGVFGYSIYKDKEQTKVQENIQKELIKKLEEQKQEQVPGEENEKEIENTLSPQELVFSEFIKAKKEGDMKKTFSKIYSSELALEEFEELEKNTPPEMMEQVMKLLGDSAKEYQNFTYTIKDSNIEGKTAVLLVSAIKDERQKADQQVFFVKEGDNWLINVFGSSHPADTIVESPIECNTYCASQDLYPSGNVMRKDTKECFCYYEKPILGEAMLHDTCEEKPKNMRDGCYLRLAERQKEAKYCKNVSMMNRNSCYENVAVAKKDDSVCDEMWEDSSCLEKVKKVKNNDGKEVDIEEEIEELKCFGENKEYCYDMEKGSILWKMAIKNLPAEIAQTWLPQGFTTFNEQEIWEVLCEMSEGTHTINKRSARHPWVSLSENEISEIEKLQEQLDFEQGVYIEISIIHTLKDKEYVTSKESCAANGFEIKKVLTQEEWRQQESEEMALKGSREEKIEPKNIEKESEDLRCFGEGFEICYNIGENKILSKIVTRNLPEEFVQMVFSDDFTILSEQETWNILCQKIERELLKDKELAMYTFASLPEEQLSEAETLLDQLDFEKGVLAEASIEHTVNDKEYIANTESCEAHGHIIEVQESMTPDEILEKHLKSLEEAPVVNPSEKNIEADFSLSTIDYKDVLSVPESEKSCFSDEKCLLTQDNVGVCLKDYNGRSFCKEIQRINCSTDKDCNDDNYQTKDICHNLFWRENGSKYCINYLLEPKTEWDDQLARQEIIRENSNCEELLFIKFTGEKAYLNGQEIGFVYLNGVYGWGKSFAVKCDDFIKLPGVLKYPVQQKYKAISNSNFGDVADFEGEYEIIPDIN